jgi:putative ABC transport system permease protein
MSTIKQELSKLSWVERITTSSTIPGQSYRHEVYFSLKGSDEQSLLYIEEVDTSFAKTYGMRLLAGTDFATTDGPHINANKLMINETAARALGLSAEDAIHKLLMDQEEGETYTIVGVVKDFHKLSLKERIEPSLFQYNPRRGYITLNLVSEAANSLGDKISELKTVWQTVYQDQPFEYFFLTDMYYGQYEAENFFQKVFSVFTFVSLFLACLGLIGLATFEVTNGRLEVGIRKTFGASFSDVLALFLKKYLILLLVATIIGASVSYYIMSLWLEEYSFRILLGVQHLLIPPFVLLVIALATISFQLIRLSLTNPAKVLREE